MEPKNRTGKILMILLFFCMAPLTTFLGVEALQQHRTGKAVLELAGSAGWMALAFTGAARLYRLLRDQR